MPTSASPAGSYAVGRNVSVFSLANTTIDGSGNITSNPTPLSLLGSLDSARFAFSLDLVEISAAAAAYRNYVPTKGDFDISAVEIKPANGNSVLETAFFSGSIAAGTGAYVYLTTSNMSFLSGAAVGKAVSLFAVLNSLDFPIEEGKQLVTATFKPCGIAPIFA